MENRTEDQEKIEELKTRIFKSPNASDLYIARIPKEMKQFLTEFANEHCCGDYGWALSMLLGPMTEELKNLQIIIEDMDKRLSVLERPKEFEKEKKPVGRARFKGGIEQ